MANLPGMTKREAEAFLSRVSNRGDLSPEEGVVEIRVRLKESELALLQRAREVLSANGKVPTDQEILVKGLEDLLRKRDPMEKAKRAMKRLENSAKSEGDGAAVPSPGTGIMRTVEPEEVSSTAPGQCRESVKGVELLNRSPGTGVVDKFNRTKVSDGKREPIPALEVHRVWLRDQGQCTFVYPNGDRCCERTMLEVDHILMICRGGTNELGNLRLLCRNHNMEMAERALGKDFMGQWVGSKSGSKSLVTP
jgi:5-methylcytosine-specific restriction endonuclease McrA